MEAANPLHSPSSSSSSSTSAAASHAACPPPAAAAPPTSPVPRTIDTSPYPTTFVQADPSSFKQVVQMLTGAPIADKPNPPPAAPAARATAPKKQSFKLFERRSGMRNLKMISPLPSATAMAAARRAAPDVVLSPSLLDFPSLALSSPVTPLTPDPFNKAAEEKAIKEKGFYLHPSPRSVEPPTLLPLFPETSPRAAARESPLLELGR